MSLSEEKLDALLAAANDKVSVTNLLCRNVVGVERWERKKEQRLFITFTYDFRPAHATWFFGAYLSHA